MNAPDMTWFDHERLDVYRETIGFIAWLSAITEGAQRLGDVRDQLERASTSMALNLAEGNAKYSLRDRCRYFDIAYGSALECAAALDVLVARRRLAREAICDGKDHLQRIVRMVIGLIKSNRDGGDRTPKSGSTK